MQARAADIKDVAPSETLHLDKSKILGFITQGGSGNSHTAILARTMGIPAICGLGDTLKEEVNGRMAYIDGETGQVAIEPDDITLDGRHMMVYCNIGSPEDVAAVHNNDSQGIGLFRSEFLYLAASDYPTEDEQFQAYKEVAAAMDGKRSWPARWTSSPSAPTT